MWLVGEANGAFDFNSAASHLAFTPFNRNEFTTVYRVTIVTTYKYIYVL